MKINSILILSSILLITSCVSSKDASLLKTDANASKSNAAAGAAIGDAQVNIDTGLALKTFNQYNQTLSKVTGIDAATPAILTEYDLIKNSLPSDHTATSYTPFHQISQTRLSFAYCSNFIDTNTAFNTGLDYATITPQNATTKLLEKFIGIRPAKGFEIYDKFNEVILKIMSNDAGVDANNMTLGKLVPSTTATAAVVKKNLTKLACTAILSSTEFTTL